MKKLFLGSIIAFCLAFVVSSSLNLILLDTKDVKLKTLSYVNISSDISRVINMKDKVIAPSKNVSNTQYINSWKLTGTIIGKTSFAMVIKESNSKILRIDGQLEGFKVKKILKEKVLFSSKDEDIWLYIKRKNVKLQNLVNKVIPASGSFSIRKATFKRTILSPERLLKTINIIPELVDGRFKGFKVKHLLEGSFLYMHGLRQDDIIKKINGKKLLSMADGINAYQGIASNNKFSISVLRDNKIKEIKYEVVK